MFLNKNYEIWKKNIAHICYINFVRIRIVPCLTKHGITVPWNMNSVHVLLVSLLVDQKVPSMWFWSVSWSTNCPVYFSLFLVDQKKICSVSENFWSGSDFFGPPSFFLVYQNFFLVYQKIRAWQKKFRDWPKIPWDWTNFFLVDQKKWEIDRTIGRPRDWPKPHGRDFCKKNGKYKRVFFFVCLFYTFWMSELNFQS